MNVVDSSAWLEYLADSANARHFAEAIEDTELLVVPVLVVYEVFKNVLRQRGEEDALQAVAALHQGLVVPLDGELALEAARLGHELKLALADSVILATARRHDALLWTQDQHFAGLEDVRYFPKK